MELVAHTTGHWNKMTHHKLRNKKAKETTFNKQQITDWYIQQDVNFIDSITFRRLPKYAMNKLQRCKRKSLIVEKFIL